MSVPTEPDRSRPVLGYLAVSRRDHGIGILKKPLGPGSVKSAVGIPTNIPNVQESVE